MQLRSSAAFASDRWRSWSVEHVLIVLAVVLAAAAPASAFGHANTALTYRPVVARQPDCAPCCRSACTTAISTTSARIADRRGADRRRSSRRSAPPRSSSRCSTTGCPTLIIGRGVFVLASLLDRRAGRRLAHRVRVAVAATSAPAERLLIVGTSDGRGRLSRASCSSAAGARRRAGRLRRSRPGARRHAADQPRRHRHRRGHSGHRARAPRRSRRRQPGRRARQAADGRAARR